MTEGVSSRQKQWQLFWWSVSLGLLLSVINIAFFFLLVFSTVWGVNPNLRELSAQDPLLELKSLLVLALLFFLVGVALGRWLRKMRLVILVNFIACLIGTSAMVAIAAIMVVFGIGAKEAGWIFIDVVFGAWFLILTEGVAVVGGGALGGFIGSRFLRRRSTSA